jgi:hypothetical protein
MERNKEQGWKGVEYLTPSIVHILVCSMCVIALIPCNLSSNPNIFHLFFLITSKHALCYSYQIVRGCFSSSKFVFLMSLFHWPIIKKKNFGYFSNVKIFTPHI